MFRQQKAGNHAFLAGHQTAVGLKPLFPKGRDYGEKTKFGEDESSIKD